MKRSVRYALVLALSAFWLTVSAFADFGPKPQLTITVENPPEEVYYLDLLEEETGNRYDLYENLTEEDLAQLDPALYQALLSAVPEGWHACLAQGTGVPMWGSLTGEDGIHSFHYVGVPEEYRVLVVTAGGECWISQPASRGALQTSARLDWERKILSVPPVWLSYVVQFLCTCLATLAIEGLLLLAFGLWRRENLPVFLLTNLVTQMGLTAAAGNALIQHGTISYWLIFLPAELFITVVEALFYRRHLQGGTPRRRVLYGLCANLCSAAAGVLFTGWLFSFVNRFL